MIPGEPSDDPSAIRSGPLPIHKNDLLFFAQVGVCMLEWARVDRCMFYTLSEVLKADDVVVEVIHKNTRTMEARFVLLNDLIQARFPKKPGEHDHLIVRDFKELTKSARDLMTFRNRIAHGAHQQITHIYGDITPEQRATLPGFHSVIHTAGLFENDLKAIDVAALREHQKQVFELTEVIRKFRADVRSALAV